MKEKRKRIYYKKKSSFLVQKEVPEINPEDPKPKEEERDDPDELYSTRVQEPVKPEPQVVIP
jgi:hypothetical protein